MKGDIRKDFHHTWSYNAIKCDKHQFGAETINHWINQLINKIID